MPKMICFDMDGTIADLYAVPGWLEKLRAEDATPYRDCLLYTSPSPRDISGSRMPSSA